MIRREIEAWIHRKLLSIGWRVTRVGPLANGWEHGRAYWDSSYIRRLKFNPATIIDVGVARGTPQLYDAFPDAYLLLIEPLAEFSTDISRILTRRRGVYVPVAAGRHAADLELWVDASDPLQTSFYRRHPLETTEGALETRRVPVKTLDEIVAGHPCPRPFGLKIDVEGAELEVLQGAPAVLAETQFLIAEVNVIDRFKGAYKFAELVEWVDAAGFCACDILDIGRSTASAVTFFDLVFRKKEHLCASS